MPAIQIIKTKFKKYLELTEHDKLHLDHFLSAAPGQGMLFCSALHTNQLVVDFNLGTGHST
jgi:hypothetical protein